jgi:hypothetical protein
MIDITGQIIGAERVTMRLLDAPRRVIEGVRTEVERLGLEIQRKVKENKLTGPRPQNLGVKTGRLRRSINLQVTEAANAVKGAVGTNVAYARRWELGGNWVENVRAHVRRNRQQIAAATYTTKKGTTKISAKGRSSGAIAVQAFSRDITVKARPFLAPVLEEMRNPIRVRLAKAVSAATGGK